MKRLFKTTGLLATICCVLLSCSSGEENEKAGKLCPLLVWTGVHRAIWILAFQHPRQAVQ